MKLYGPNSEIMKRYIFMCLEERLQIKYLLKNQKKNANSNALVKFYYFFEKKKQKIKKY